MADRHEDQSNKAKANTGGDILGNAGGNMRNSDNEEPADKAVPTGAGNVSDADGLVAAGGGNVKDKKR